MTFRFSVNNPYSITNTGQTHLYDFKQFMKSSSPTGPGWTVSKSGDGLAAFSSTGDIITSSGSGAGGLGNTNAWFVLQEPNGQREFLWQRGASSGSWVILYSYSARFTGGAAATRPSATDAVVVLGSTSNPATAAASSHFSTSFNSIFHFGANDADGYSFFYGGYAQSYITSNNNATACMFFDELQSGTYNDGYETDPRIIYIAGGNSSNNYNVASVSSNTTSTDVSRVVGFLYKGTIYESFGTISGLGYVVNHGNASAAGTGTGYACVPGFVGMDLFTKKDIVLPIFYARRGTDNVGAGGFKGVGKYLKYKATRRPYGTTISVVSHNDYIIMGDLAFPFSGGEAQF